nr:zinc finger, TAZ-type [Tanacetum cinerariifolium]
MLRRKIDDKNDDDENVPLYYHINKDFSIPFGREEFCLVPGLKFGVQNWAEYDTKERIPFRRRVFPSYLDGQPITGLDIENMIVDQSFAHLYDNDAVSLCCLRILQLVILGVESRRVVPDWMLRLANDIVAWKKYPWGSYVWPTLYSQLRNANVKRWSLLYVPQPANENDMKMYSIFGYTWAFKTWILESFRETAIRYFYRYNRYPRVAAWSMELLMTEEPCKSTIHTPTGCDGYLCNHGYLTSVRDNIILCVHIVRTWIQPILYDQFEGNLRYNRCRKFGDFIEINEGILIIDKMERFIEKLGDNGTDEDMEIDVKEKEVIKLGEFKDVSLVDKYMSGVKRFENVYTRKRKRNLGTDSSLKSISFDENSGLDKKHVNILNIDVCFGGCNVTDVKRGNTILVVSTIRKEIKEKENIFDPSEREENAKSKGTEMKDVAQAEGPVVRVVLSVDKELEIGYLEYCKKRGFSKCYIWSCPVVKGHNYIINCRPTTQKTPKEDKLLKWYKLMLTKAAKEGIVVDINNLHEQFSVPKREENNKITTAHLPYFDGAYWLGGCRNYKQETCGGRKLGKIV